MNIIETVRQFVEEECKKPTSKYGYEPYEFHFVSVVKYAEMLLDELGGDKEIILVAAWLHDIGSIMVGRHDHHITGAEIAAKKLQEIGYPTDKIEHVKQCILNHRGSQNRERSTIEEQIVAEADAMSNFDNIAGILKAALVYENKTQGEAREDLLRKLENKWSQLHFEKSKEIIRPKYEALQILFGK